MGQAGISDPVGSDRAMSRSGVIVDTVIGPSELEMQQLMFSGRKLSWNRPARALVLGLGLVVTGCGESPKPKPAQSDAASNQVAQPQASATAKVKSKGRGEFVAPGGDLDRRERKAQKLKEKAAPAS